VAKEVEFVLPAASDPVWQSVDPQIGLPEAYRMRTAFLSDHMHEGQHGNPMADWALPLRNPDALRGGVDLAGLRERLMREIGKQ